jgi:hypothetical protein
MGFFDIFKRNKEPEMPEALAKVYKLFFPEGIGQQKKSILLRRKHKKSPAVSPNRKFDESSPVLSKNKKFDSEENEFFLPEENENNKVSSPIKKRKKEVLSGMEYNINSKTT